MQLLLPFVALRFFFFLLYQRPSSALCWNHYWDGTYSLQRGLADGVWPSLRKLRLSADCAVAPSTSLRRRGCVSCDYQCLWRTCRLLSSICVHWLLVTRYGARGGVSATVAVVGDVWAGGIVGLGVAPVVTIEGVGGWCQRVMLGRRGIWVKDFGRRRAFGRKVILSGKIRGKMVNILIGQADRSSQEDQSWSFSTDVQDFWKFSTIQETLNYFS